MPIFYCDGLCEPYNPGGYACYGWLSLDSDGQQIAQGYGGVARGAGATNNISEYSALIAGKLFLAPMPLVVLEVQR
jgi:ribonuclease HI